ncbi:MAG: hypothetical protein HUJ99_07700, partial [Bacteroidaceae bacterium]|nr:hypothetical protein [Bacteroidaceae bacterium]
MKKASIWLGCILAVPVGFFVLLTALLYIPPVQQYVARKAAQSAASLLEMEVQIGRVRVTPFFDFSIDDFLAVQGKDTILNVKKLVADVPFLPLLKGEVDVDGLELNGAKVNTKQLIESVEVSGTLDYFALDSRGVLLKNQQVTIQEAALGKADLRIVVRDSVPDDTTSTPVDWIIDLQKVTLTDAKVQLLMDTMNLRARVGKASVKKVHLDLPANLYQVDQATLSRSFLALDLNTNEPAEGLDYAHIALDSIELDIRSVCNQGANLSLEVKKARMKERSGLELTSLSGLWQMDANTFHAHQFELSTPFSSASLHADVDMNALDTEKPDGNMDVKLNVEVGRQDLLLAAGPTLAKDLEKLYPDRNLVAQANVSGNMRHLTLEETHVNLEDAM